MLNKNQNEYFAENILEPFIKERLDTVREIYKKNKKFKLYPYNPLWQFEEFKDVYIEMIKELYADSKFINDLHELAKNHNFKLKINLETFDIDIY